MVNVNDGRRTAPISQLTEGAALCSAFEWNVAADVWEIGTARDHNSALEPSA